VSLLPSRARRLTSLLIGEHVGVDDVGEASFERAHGLHRGLAGGLLGVEVGTSLGRVPQLDDGHDVQCPVDAPVPGPGEPVTFLVTGGGVQGCSAVPGGELVAVGKAVDVAQRRPAAGPLRRDRSRSAP
jgi:hypothetical protein